MFTLAKTASGNSEAIRWQKQEAVLYQFEEELSSLYGADISRKSLLPWGHNSPKLVRMFTKRARGSHATQFKITFHFAYIAVGETKIS